MVILHSANSSFCKTLRGKGLGDLSYSMQGMFPDTDNCCGLGMRLRHLTGSGNETETPHSSTHTCVCTYTSINRLALVRKAEGNLQSAVTEAHRLLRELQKWESVCFFYCAITSLMDVPCVQLSRSPQEHSHVQLQVRSVVDWSHSQSVPGLRMRQHDIPMCILNIMLSHPSGFCWQCKLSNMQNITMCSD